MANFKADNVDNSNFSGFASTAAKNIQVRDALCVPKDTTTFRI